MQCIYTKPLGNGAGMFYFNGVDTVHITNFDTVKLLQQIYKANNGKDMPEYRWTDPKAPWHIRLEQVAPNRK